MKYLVVGFLWFIVLACGYAGLMIRRRKDNLTRPSLRLVKTNGLLVQEKYKGGIK